MTNLIINNKLISGEIDLNTDQSQRASNEIVSIDAGNRNILINIKDLQKDLYNKGMKDLRFDRSKDYLVIFSRKQI